MQLKATALAAIVSIGTVLPAQAATYNWSFSFPGGISGGGTLDTGAAEPNNGFLITGITGTWTDALGTENILAILPPGHLNNNDNVLYPTSTPLLDSNGFAFSVAQEFVQVGFFSIPLVGAGYGYATFSSAGANCAAPGTSCSTNGFAFSNASTDVFTAAPTPLPAALPLFATGIGAMGLIGWRRKRKTRAVA